MIQSYVTVSFRLEGVHAWPGVKEHPELNRQVGFLAFPHRHMFHFSVIKTVQHNDRDVEIIVLKREMENYLVDKYLADHGCLDFGNMSCEDIAQELILAFDLERCSVLEDGENGAILISEKEEYEILQKGSITIPKGDTFSTTNSVADSTKSSIEEHEEVCIAVKKTINEGLASGHYKMRTVLVEGKHVCVVELTSKGKRPDLEDILKNSPIRLTPDLIKALKYASERTNNVPFNPTSHENSK
jgi:hypothetical protein